MLYALFNTIQRHYALFSRSCDGTHNHFIQGKTLKMGPTALFKHFKCVNMCHDVTRGCFVKSGCMLLLLLLLFFFFFLMHADYTGPCTMHCSALFRGIMHCLVGPVMGLITTLFKGKK